MSQCVIPWIQSISWLFLTYQRSSLPQDYSGVEYSLWILTKGRESIQLYLDKTVKKIKKHEVTAICHVVGEGKEKDQGWESSHQLRGRWGCPVSYQLPSVLP